MSALEKIMELAPRAVEEAERILNRSKSMNARIQMIEIVLNRAYGKPEAALRIETGGRSITESAAALQAEIRAVMENMEEEQTEIRAASGQDRAERKEKMLNE